METKVFDYTAPLNFAECEGDTITGYLLGITNEQFEQVAALEAKQTEKRLAALLTDTEGEEDFNTTELIYSKMQVWAEFAGIDEAEITKRDAMMAIAGFFAAKMESRIEQLGEFLKSKKSE